ncbi:cell division protein [Lasius niger]|uniref:Cell division protein n=1 Tax=Lasius niger TaxID=67767 RepID=A0A0J7KLS3_LASNI|nr:cell division protein [Lasius niger]
MDDLPIDPPATPRLWLYHKPSGLITTHSDPLGRPTIFENLPKDLPRVISIGRLDLNSEGLILLTNDGNLSRELELPDRGWKRIYRVRVFGTIDREALKNLKNGIVVEGVQYKSILAEPEGPINSGRNTWLKVQLLEENELGNKNQAEEEISYQDSFPPTHDEDTPNAWTKTLHFLSNFCGLFFGLSFLILASYFFLALMTFNQFDPNLDTANGNPVQNMTGILGADISNVLLHFFGIGSFLIAILFAGWGIELIYAGKPGNIVTRTLGGIAFLFSGATFASLFEWIFFAPNGVETWKHFIPDTSLGGHVGAYFGGELLSLISVTSPQQIPPESAVFLIFIGMLILIGTGAVAFRMPLEYWASFGRFFLNIYHHFFPEKASRRPYRKHSLTDSPFSDVHHPSPKVPDSLEPGSSETKNTANPWFSTKNESSEPEEEVISKPDPFAQERTAPNATPIHRSPLPPVEGAIHFHPPKEELQRPPQPQLEAVRSAVPTAITAHEEKSVQDTLREKETVSHEKAALEEAEQISENLQDETAEDSSVFSSLGRYFSPRPQPTAGSPFEPAPQQHYIGTPPIRNTYNLHRDEDEYDPFHHDGNLETETPLSQQPYSAQSPAEGPASARPAVPPASPIATPPPSPTVAPAETARQTATQPSYAQPEQRPTPQPQQTYAPQQSAAQEAAPQQPTTPAPRPAIPSSPYSKENWVKPSLSLLEDRPPNEDIPTEEELKEMGESLEQVLAEYKIKGKVVAIRRGPVATLFEFRPIAGTRESQIVTLSDDIARSLAVANIRITRVSGRNTVGLEVPNHMRDMVSFVELLNNPTWTGSKGYLELALGKNVTGKPVYADLAKMPHLLVAGTTGSGKSVGMNAMLLSLLLRLSPEDCRMILVDPKKLEFSLYEGIPHLLTPVITEADKALGALRWAVGEMERRYQFLADAGVRNIVNYNHRAREIRAGRASNIRTYQSGNDPQTGLPITEEVELPSEHLPYIVIVIDEMADLIMSDGKGKEIEAGVVRLAQKARACGIHLIIATQRPSADVITGLIKANFPSRIAFQVTNKIDSRIVLDVAGGEQLLGNGDMLFRFPGKPIIRLHGPYISEDEVDAVANDLRSKQAPIYNSDIAQKMEEAASEESSKGGGSDSGGGSSGDKDELYEEAVEIIFKHKRATASFLQRQLSIGYNRASKIIETMEEEGIVGPASASGKRDILGRKPPKEEDDGFSDDSFSGEEDDENHLF